MSSTSLNKSSLVINKHRNVSHKKGMKYFRPWIVKCNCIECNMTIDSNKLMDLLKKAIEEELEERRSLTLKNSGEDLSDNRSISSDNSTTIVDVEAID